jgi:hypothetical protein
MRAEQVEVKGAAMPSFNFRKQLKLGAAFIEDRRGAAAIVMAVMTPIVIGGLAFGAEAGFWELTKRKVQNAADAAAFAAGTQLRSGASSTTMTAAALSIATASGYSGGSSGLTLQHPPSSAPVAANGVNPNGDNRYVYVTLSQNIPRQFTKFFSGGSSTVEINGSAIALVQSGRPACVLALHPSASGAISTGGSTSVNLNGCDIAANSISSSAITATGNGSSVNAECISAVGNVSVNNTYNLVCGAPITNAPLTADPYAYVPMPSSASCTSTNTLNQFPNSGSGTMRCYSGSSGGVSWNNNITLASNTTYVFENTGTNTLNFRPSGNGRVTGTGVTLVFKGKWNVSANGNTRIDITAPTTGTYKGIAIFGDRANNVDIDISGNNAGRIVGALYSANRDSNITYTGSSTAYGTGQCTQVIGGTITFWGNSNFTTSCSNSGTTEIKAAQSIKIVG